MFVDYKVGSVAVNFNKLLLYISKTLSEKQLLPKMTLPAQTPKG